MTIVSSLVISRLVRAVEGTAGMIGQYVNSPIGTKLWREAVMSYIQLLPGKMPGGTTDNQQNTSIRSTMSSPSCTKKNC